MSRRIKISGAQWNEKNVPQVLAHRSAYLNGFMGRKGDMLPTPVGVGEPTRTSSKMIWSARVMDSTGLSC